MMKTKFFLVCVLLFLIAGCALEERVDPVEECICVGVTVTGTCSSICEGEGLTSLTLCGKHMVEDLYDLCIIAVLEKQEHTCKSDADCTLGEFCLGAAQYKGATIPGECRR